MKTTRQQAMMWWYGLTTLGKSTVMKVSHSSERKPETLTGREIEEIWKLIVS